MKKEMIFKGFFVKVRVSESKVRVNCEFERNFFSKNAKVRVDR